jgi:hypothetical protein
MKKIVKKGSKLKDLIGKAVVVRVSMAGVITGVLSEVVVGQYIVLTEAAKLWSWRVAEVDGTQHVAVEGIANSGITDATKAERVPISVIGWQDGLQIIPLSDAAIRSIAALP